MQIKAIGSVCLFRWELGSGAQSCHRSRGPFGMTPAPQRDTASHQAGAEHGPTANPLSPPSA